MEIKVSLHLTINKQFKFFNTGISFEQERAPTYRRQRTAEQVL